jgi:DHA1 family bicyclomycin/chloramphenicol resistance-like MFS transporter
LSRFGRYYLIGLLGLLTAADAIAIDVLIPAMPQLRHAFSIDAAQAGATISVFMLGLAMGQLIYGPLSDRYGRKPPLIAGLALFVAGSALPLLEQTYAFLMMGRWLQALGASAGLVIARAVVVDRFPEDECASIYSVLLQILGLSTIAAPIVGGYLAESPGWQSIFLLLACLGLVCLIAVIWTLEESRLRGATTAPVSNALAGVGEFLRDRVFVVYCLSAGCMMAGMFATLVGNAFIFVDGFGWSPMSYAILCASGCFGFVVVGFLNILALRRYQAVQLATVSLGVIAANAVVLWLIGASGTASAWNVAALTMGPLALMGFVFGNIGALAMGRARNAAGTGSSLLGISQYAMGGLAGPAAAAFYCSALLLLIGKGRTSGSQSTSSQIVISSAPKEDDPCPRARRTQCDT